MDNASMYGDFTPRESGYVYKKLLERAIPGNVTELILQSRPIPKNSTGVAIFRRYNSLTEATTPLSEYTTPEASKVTYTDVTVTLQPYGDWIQFTNKLQDLHPDNLLSEFADILSEQMVRTRELLNIAALKAGTVVYYANGTARTDVNTFTTVGQLQKVVRGLRNQNTKPITKILAASPDYATTPVPACYVLLCDTDCVADFENLAGFAKVHTYANPGAALSIYEVGAIADFRVIATSLFDAWPDAGGLAATNGSITTTGTQADVYPLICVGQDAAATVPLRGGDSGSVKMVSTKPSKSDPMGRVGSLAWNFWHAVAIVQDLYMARIEVAVTLNPTV